MSDSTWIVLVLAFVAFLCGPAVWKKVRAKSARAGADAQAKTGPKSQQAPAKPPSQTTDLRRGRAPHPTAPMLDLSGGIRLIDLRAMPADDLAAARLGIPHNQLRLERPASTQIWVVDVVTARAWTQSSPLARALIAKRLADPRSPDDKNYLYTTGGRLDEIEQQTFAEAGLDTITSMTNLSNPPKDIEDLLIEPARWAPSVDDRPVPEHDVIRSELIGHEFVRVIEGFAFVDVRRLGPDAFASPFAISQIEKGVAKLQLMKPVKPIAYVVWVVAPWVLELLSDDHVAGIERLVDSIAPPIQQRLAISTAAGEPVGEHDFTRRLGRKLRPLSEMLQMKTADHGTFHVSPMDLLHDAYFVTTWKQARG